MIKTVELKNWKSHKDTELGFEKGVNGLIGSMGSGKSSVLEGVVFALFGTTPKHNSREVTLDDLIRRSPEKADKATVKIEFELYNKNYSVLREIERDKGTTKSVLKKEGDVVESPSTREVTEQVEKLLGLDFNAFTRAVYAEQNHLDLFLNMRPGDRKERVDELLDIKRFEEARKNVVKVKNTLEKEKKQEEKAVQQLDDELDEEVKEELEKDIQETSQSIEETSKIISELENKLEKKRKSLEKLKKRDKQSKKLDKRITRLETKEESLEERINEFNISKDFENPKKRIEELSKTKESLEEKREKLKQLRKEEEFVSRTIEELRKEVEILQDEAEKFEKVEELEKKIEEREKRLKSIEKKVNRFYAERKELEKSLKTVKSSEEDCPVCGKELTEEHRRELTESKDKRIKEVRQKEKELKEELDKRKQRLEKLDKRREDLLEYKSSSKKLEKKETKLEEVEEKKEDLEEEIGELSSSFSEKDLENIENRIELLQKVKEKRRLEKKLESIKQKQRDVAEKLKDLEFSEEELEETREDYSELKKKYSVEKKGLQSKKDLLDEKKKRLKSMEKQFSKKKKLEETVQRLESLLEFLNSYSNGLEKTQVSVRELFVDELNSLMDSIWSQVYPYDDYYGIRLNVEEAYRLQVLSSDNEWVNAEAEISGGERHLSALVMRLALTFTLSPSFQILMLDEPTHNMDSDTVESLAETLSKNTDLVDQMFVVTHDSSMESAITGSLYRLDKKSTETGLTEIEKLN